MPISPATSNLHDFASNFDSARSSEARRRRHKSSLQDFFAQGDPLNNELSLTAPIHRPAAGNGQVARARPQRQHRPRPMPLLSAIGVILFFISIVIFATAFVYMGAYKGAYNYLRFSRKDFVPDAAAGDYSWIEYLPHAHDSRFRQAPATLSPANRDMAAAWRVFGAHEVNVRWADAAKEQPTDDESHACFLEVKATADRLAAIWDPRRGVDVGDEYPKAAPGSKAVLGLSADQLRAVGQVLRYAYRDAVFLCMTPAFKTEYLAIVEANEKPHPARFFKLEARKMEEERRAEGKKFADEVLEQYWAALDADAPKELRGLSGLQAGGYSDCVE